MNKPTIIVLGLLAGLLSILFLDELFKFITALIFINDHIYILFKGLKLSITFPLTGNNNFFSIATVLLTPLIGSIIFIETSLIWLAKTASERIRSFLIIFQLVNIGYLIFTIFIIIFSVLLKSPVVNEWQTFLNNGNLSNNQKLIFILMMAIILLSYVNILAKRIKKSIPVISRK
jgi:hypothetical protein